MNPLHDQYYGAALETWLEPIAPNDTPQVIALKGKLEWATQEIENVRRSQSESYHKCSTKLELYRVGFWVALAFIALAGFLKWFYY